MIMKNVLFIAFLFAIAVLLTHYGINTVVDTVGTGTVAGFWWGLWNGFTFPFGFVCSLFSDNIHFYEVRNNGGWYYFGFVSGIITLSRGCCKVP